MVDSVLEVKQIKQLSADGGATVVDVENKTIDGVALGSGVTFTAICFSGQLASTASSTSTLALTANTVDPFSSYSSNTFTPPIDGKYLLTLSGHIVKGAANSGHYCQLIIKVDASEVAKSADLGYGDAATVREQGAVSVVANLTTSNAVTFECFISGTVDVISGNQTIGTAIYIGN